MAFENESQAIEALTNAAAVDASASTPAVPESQPSAPVEDASAQQEQQPRIDLSHLDFKDENAVRGYLEQREREMQGDYTRKTQEVAAQRKEAEQALEFIQALNTDPSFAYQVQQTLSQALQQQGYSVAEANAIASQQTPVEDDTFVDPYMEKIQQIENWQKQQEQRFAIADATSRIEQGIAAVRQANPNYTDDDVKDILTMAFAYNGDVIAAADAFKSVTQRVTEGYLAQKAAVPASLNQPTSAGHAEIPPEGFKSLNDPRLEEAAKKMLLASDPGAQW